MWAYIFFFIHLDDTKPNDYTALDLYVSNLVGINVKMDFFEELGVQKIFFSFSWSAFRSLLLIGIERMKYFILFTLEQANSNFLN